MQLSYKSVSEEFRISRPFIHKTLCLLLDSQRSFLDTVFYALASEIQKIVVEIEGETHEFDLSYGDVVVTVKYNDTIGITLVIEKRINMLGGV